MYNQSTLIILCATDSAQLMYTNRFGRVRGGHLLQKKTDINGKTVETGEIQTAS